MANGDALTFSIESYEGRAGRSVTLSIDADQLVIKLPHDNVRFELMEVIKIADFISRYLSDEDMLARLQAEADAKA